MDPKTIGKIAIQRAITSPATYVIALASVVAAGSLWEFWPIVCGAVAEFYWVMYKAKSKRSIDTIIREETDRQAAQRDTDRRSRLEYVRRVCASATFAQWIRSGQFPDYLLVYDRLSEQRDRIVRLAHDRQEITESLEQNVVENVEMMLTAFLQFVVARIVYLQSLAGVALEGGGGSTVAPQPTSGIRAAVRRVGEFVRDVDEDDDERYRERARRSVGSPAVAFPSLTARTQEIEQRITELEARAKREPATAETRQKHIKLLRQRIEQLKEFEARDQRADAQLDMLADTMNILVSHVSATRVRSSDITATVEGAVTGVRDAQSFIDEMSPFMDSVMAGGMDLALTTEGNR